MKHQQRDLTHMLRRPVELAAMKGPSAQTKTAPVGAAFDSLLCDYDCFRLAKPTKPIKPIKPEPNRKTAAGTETAGISGEIIPPL